MKENYKLLACGLLVGLAVGYAGSVIWNDDATTTETAELKPSVTGKTPVTDAGETSSLTALRARIKTLEAALAARSAATTNMPPEPADRESHGEPPRPHSFSRRLAEIREKDPARYAQMTNNMARFRMSRLAQAEKRLETLAGLDTSRWSAQARQTHEKYQELIARREELMETMRPDDDTVSEEDRQKGHEEMRQLHRQIRSLEQAERTQLLSATAEEFGITGKDAQELVETVRAVWETTSDRGGPPPGPPPGGR